MVSRLGTCTRWSLATSRLRLAWLTVVSRLGGWWRGRRGGVGRGAPRPRAGRELLDMG